MLSVSAGTAFPVSSLPAAKKLMGFLMVGDGEKACWLVACWSSGMMIHLLLSSLSGLTENGKERIFFLKKLQMLKVGTFATLIKKTYCKLGEHNL